MPLFRAKQKNQNINQKCFQHIVSKQHRRLVSDRWYLNPTEIIQNAYDGYKTTQDNIDFRYVHNLMIIFSSTNVDY